MDFTLGLPKLWRRELDFTLGLPKLLRRELDFTLGLPKLWRRELDFTLGLPKPWRHELDFLLRPTKLGRASFDTALPMRPALASTSVRTPANRPAWQRRARRFRRNPRRRRRTDIFAGEVGGLGHADRNIGAPRRGIMAAQGVAELPGEIRCLCPRRALPGLRGHPPAPRLARRIHHGIEGPLLPEDDHPGCSFKANSRLTSSPRA